MTLNNQNCTFFTCIFVLRKIGNDSQIHTIVIKEDKEKVLQFLPNQVFDYCANTCEKDFRKDIPGIQLNFNTDLLKCSVKVNRCCHLFKSLTCIYTKEATKGRLTFPPSMYACMIHCCLQGQLCDDRLRFESEFDQDS